MIPNAPGKEPLDPASLFSFPAWRARRRAKPERKKSAEQFPSVTQGGALTRLPG